MERNPDTNHTTEKIPHSHRFGENPVKEFDNTSLEEAVQEGLIQTPDHIQDLIPTEALPATEKKKGRKGILIGASAGLASIAIAAGAAFGISSANNDSELPSEPVAEVPAEPGVGSEVEAEASEAEVEKSAEQLVAELQIPAGLSAEDYAKILFEDRQPQWDIAGVGDDFFEALLEANRSSNDNFFMEYSEEQAKIFAEALFIPNYKEVPSLANVYKFNVEYTAAAYTDWVRTYDYDDSKTTPEWSEGGVVTNVEIISEDQEAGTRTIYIQGYQTNNAAESFPESVNADLDGRPWDHTIETQTIGSVEYISDWLD